MNKKLLVCLFVLLSVHSYAANLPLVMTLPRTNLPTNHRITKQYPGIEYNFRITLVGGAYPFTCSLTNAPSGMTVTTNEIVVWSNPVAGSYTITATCSDDELTEVSASWDLTVSTTGFNFVDSSNGTADTSNGCSMDCGDGTLANPWLTINDAYENTSAGEFIYLIGGGADFSTADLPTSGGTCDLGVPQNYSLNTTWNTTSRPVVFLGHPSYTRPVIDFGFDGTWDVCPETVRPWELYGATVWLDYLEVKNVFPGAFWLYSGSTFGGIFHGPTCRRLISTDMHGLEGSNGSLCITNRTNSTNKYGGYFGENSCRTNTATPMGADCVKLYEEDYILIANNEAYSNGLFNSDGVFALKFDVAYFDVRQNTCYDIAGGCLGGNTDANGTGEVRYNNLKLNSTVHPSTSQVGNSFHINQQGNAGEVWIYRNTFVGRVWIRNISAGDGPFHFDGNVFQNGDNTESPVAFICMGAVGSAGYNICGGTAESIYTYGDNLTGTSGLVDSDGLLVNRAYVGTYGWEINEDSEPDPEPDPPSVSGITYRIRGLR